MVAAVEQDFRFRMGDQVRVIKQDSAHYLHCGLIQERRVSEAHCCTQYRLFGQFWFCEHDLDWDA